MAIHYRLDEETGVVVTEISGAVSVEEITQLFHSAAADPQVGLRHDSLVDLRNAEPLSLTITDIDYVASITKSSLNGDSNRKIAFLSEDETNVGLCTLFQEFAKGPGRVIELFTDFNVAWNWLVDGESASEQTQVGELPMSGRS